MEPLTVAAENEHDTVVRILLEKGAGPKAKSSPLANPLECAIQGGQARLPPCSWEKEARWIF